MASPAVPITCLYAKKVQELPKKANAKIKRAKIIEERFEKKTLRHSNSGVALVLMY